MENTKKKNIECVCVCVETCKHAACAHLYVRLLIVTIYSRRESRAKRQDSLSMMKNQRPQTYFHCPSIQASVLAFEDKPTHSCALPFSCSTSRLSNQVWGYSLASCSSQMVWGSKYSDWDLLHEELQLLMDKLS